MIRKVPLALSLAMTFGMVPQAAQAQMTRPTPGPSGNAAVLPEVVSTSQAEGEKERKRSEKQTLVIHEEEVERYDDATVGDVLRRLPAMTFSGPAGMPSTIRMRGLGAGYTQILINGEPVPGTSATRQMSVDRIPAHMIERIEIIRNPTASDESGGIGGTVNIVLKAEAEPLTRFGVAYGKTASMDVGNAMVQLNRNFGNLSTVLGLSHTLGGEEYVDVTTQRNAGGEVTSVESVPRTVQKRETLVTPRLSWRFGSDRLTIDPFASIGSDLRLNHSETRNAADALTRATETSETRTDHIARLSGRYDGETTWGNWYAKLGLQQGQAGSDQFATTTNPAGTVTQRQQQVGSTREDQGYVGTGVAVPMGAHLLKAGVEYRDTGFDTSLSTTRATDATSALAPVTPGAGDIYTIKERRAVAYLMNEWRVADAHWLTPGLRLENIDRTATDRNGASQNATTFVPNPSLHYRWALTPNTNLRSSVAQTLKNPSFADLNPLVSLASTTNTLSSPDTMGNPSLRPERALGFEAGIEQFLWSDRGVLGLNFYRRDVSDYVETIVDNTSGRFVQRPENVGQARFWGAELDARIPLLRRGAHELTLTGSHAEMRGEIQSVAVNAVTDVSDLAPRVSNLGLDWQNVASQWSAGFTVNHVPTFSATTLNPNGVSVTRRRYDQTILDLYVGKAFSPSAELKLLAKNLLSVQGGGATIQTNADGSFRADSAKVENSRPTFILMFQSRF